MKINNINVCLNKSICHPDRHCRPDVPISPYAEAMVLSILSQKGSYQQNFPWSRALEQHPLEYHRNLNKLHRLFDTWVTFDYTFEVHYFFLIDITQLRTWLWCHVINYDPLYYYDIVYFEYQLFRLCFFVFPQCLLPIKMFYLFICYKGRINLLINKYRTPLLTILNTHFDILNKLLMALVFMQIWRRTKHWTLKKNHVLVVQPTSCMRTGWVAPPIRGLYGLRRYSAHL